MQEKCAIRDSVDCTSHVIFDETNCFPGPRLMVGGFFELSHFYNALRIKLVERPDGLKVFTCNLPNKYVDFIGMQS